MKCRPPGPPAPYFRPGPSSRTPRTAAGRQGPRRVRLRCQKAVVFWFWTAASATSWNGVRPGAPSAPPWRRRLQRRTAAAWPCRAGRWLGRRAAVRRGTGGFASRRGNRQRLLAMKRKMKGQRSATKQTACASGGCHFASGSSLWAQLSIRPAPIRSAANSARGSSHRQSSGPPTTPALLSHCLNGRRGGVAACHEPAAFTGGAAGGKTRTVQVCGCGPPLRALGGLHRLHRLLGEIRVLRRRLQAPRIGATWAPGRDCLARPTTSNAPPSCSPASSRLPDALPSAALLAIKQHGAAWQQQQQQQQAGAAEPGAAGAALLHKRQAHPIGAPGGQRSSSGGSSSSAPPQVVPWFARLLLTMLPLLLLRSVNLLGAPPPGHGARVALSFGATAALLRAQWAHLQARWRTGVALDAAFLLLAAGARPRRHALERSLGVPCMAAFAARYAAHRACACRFGSSPSNHPSPLPPPHPLQATTPRPPVCCRQQERCCGAASSRMQAPARSAPARQQPSDARGPGSEEAVARPDTRRHCAHQLLTTSRMMRASRQQVVRPPSFLAIAHPRVRTSGSLRLLIQCRCLHLVFSC